MVAAPPRAVLFDFDGTLGDSYAAIAASVNHVRASHGLASLPAAEVRLHVGRGPHHLLALTVPTGDLADNVDRYVAHHPSVLRSGTRLMDGATNVLATCRRHGLRLGVCSNKPVIFTRELLAFLGIAEMFAVVLGPQDVARPKPAPDMLLAALHRLALPAGQALYVGDMTVDVQTARAAGVPVWIVATGSDSWSALEAEKPDAMFEDLAGLDRCLEDWLARGA